MAKKKKSTFSGSSTGAFPENKKSKKGVGIAKKASKGKDKK